MAGLQMKYFVLNPDSSDKAYAIASRAAMRCFARHIRESMPELAEDVNTWADGCDDMDAARSAPPAGLDSGA